MGNKLKNIKKMMDSGVHSILRADEPMISPIIWTSMYTGKKPEKHGVLDFYSTQNDLKAKQIWEILYDNCYKQGIYRPLGSWNSLEVQGFFIPSFLAFKKTGNLPLTSTWVKVNRL